jgi:hypothetical protein
MYCLNVQASLICPTDGRRDFFSSVMPHTKGTQERRPGFKPTFLVHSLKGFKGEHPSLRLILSINNVLSYGRRRAQDKAREENMNAEKVEWKIIERSTWKAAMKLEDNIKVSQNTKHSLRHRLVLLVIPIWDSLQWHDDRSKFHENRPSFFF